MYYVPSTRHPTGGELNAAVLAQAGRIELRTMEEPTAGSNEAIVRIRSVGICGTDFSIFKGKIPVAYPRIMGHEMVGEVVEAPDGAPSIGSRVIVDPNVACGRCDRCREGRANLCSNGWLMGRDRDGGLRELVPAPAANLYPLPEDLETHVAPLIQVLTTCVHAQRMCQVFPGDTVAVVGLGVTGFLHLQLSKLRGGRPVVGVTRTEAKVELARRLGADEAIVATGPRADERILEATGGGADIVIECAGTVATLAQAVRIARPGARILAFGTIADTSGPFPFYDLYYKELVLVSPRAARAEDYPVAIDAVASGTVRLDALVTHRIALPDIAAGIAAAGDPGSLKVIIET